MADSGGVGAYSIAAVTSEVGGIELNVELLDSLGIGEIIVGVKSCRVRHVNESMCKMLRRTASDLSAGTWEEIVPAEDVAALLERARSRASGVLTAAHTPVRFVRADGEIVQTLAGSVVRQFADEECLVAIVLDVTEQQRAAHRLQLVLDNGPMISFHLLDRLGRVLFYGGRTHEDITERLEIARSSTMFEAFPEQKEQFHLLWSALDGVPVSHVFQSHGRYFDVQMRPVYDAAGHVGSVAVIATDITEREQAYAEIRARSAEQAVVADLARRALHALDPGALWDAAAVALADRFDASVTVHTVAPDPGRRDPVASAGPLPTPASMSAAADAALRLSPRAADSDTDVGRPALVNTVSWTTLSIPVGRPDNPSLVVAVYRRRPRSRAAAAQNIFSEPEIDFLCSVASILSAAALRFSLEQDIRRQSLRDSLTELLNRELP